MENIEFKIKNRIFSVELIIEPDTDNWVIVREMAPNGASMIVYNGNLKGFCEFFTNL